MTGYFRIANWRQPRIITASGYKQYFQAGCLKATFGDGTELVYMTMEGGWRERLSRLYSQVDAASVVIVEGIWRDKDGWRSIVADERTGITFDLYYCGIVLFDKKRTKKNYIINF